MIAVYFIMRCLIAAGMFGAVLYLRLFDAPVRMSMPLEAILER